MRNKGFATDGRRARRALDVIEQVENWKGDGGPIAGATVIIGSAVHPNNSNGIFLTEISRGHKIITIRAAGFQGYILETDVKLRTTDLGERSR